MMTRATKLWLLALLVTVPAGAAVWYAVRPTPVEFVRPQRKDVTLSVTCEGKVRAERGSGVRSTVDGAIVRRVRVGLWDSVRGGQVVVELKDNEARAAVLRARAAVRHTAAVLAKAEADNRGAALAARQEEWRRSQMEYFARGAANAKRRLAERERDLEHWKGILADRQAKGDPAAIRRAQWYVRRAYVALYTRQSELEFYKTAKPRPLYVAQPWKERSAAAAAPIALKKAEERLAQMKVRSHFGGVVAGITVKPGDGVNRDRALLWVSTFDEVVARIPARYVGKKPLQRLALSNLLWPAYARERDARRGTMNAVPSGADAIVTVSGRCDRPLPARVQDQANVAMDIIDRVRLRGVGVRIDAAPANLRPGDPATVDIITARHKNALTLPRTAVLDPMGDAAVLVIREGRIARQPVKLDGRESLEVVVTQGLTDGEVVVRYPAQVKAGDRARPVGGRAM